MAAWPVLDEFAQVIDVQNVADWETTLDRVLASAIAKVKLDVGDWDDTTDEPDENLAQAALRMAELMSMRPDATNPGSDDPTYRRLMFGHRRSFGVA